MIVSQSLYCSEFVHRAPRRLASDRAADRKDARARAQRRKHMWARSRGRSKRPLWGEVTRDPTGQKLDRGSRRTGMYGRGSRQCSVTVDGEHIIHDILGRT